MFLKRDKSNSLYTVNNITDRLYTFANAQKQSIFVSSLVANALNRKSSSCHP